MIEMVSGNLIEKEKEKFTEDMKLFTAMKLYEENFLSLGKAAELAGKNKDEFMEEYKWKLR
ncbi:hypothetical protein ig2599ANME_0510 [groundwater metagenome]